MVHFHFKSKLESPSIAELDFYFPWCSLEMIFKGPQISMFTSLGLCQAAVRCLVVMAALESFQGSRCSGERQVINFNGKETFEQMQEHLSFNVPTVYMRHDNTLMIHFEVTGH